MKKYIAKITYISVMLQYFPVSNFIGVYKYVSDKNNVVYTYQRIINNPKKSLVKYIVNHGKGQYIESIDTVNFIVSETRIVKEK